MSNSNPSLTSQPLSLLPLLASTLSLLLLKPLFHNFFSYHSRIITSSLLYTSFCTFSSFTSPSFYPSNPSPLIQHPPLHFLPPLFLALPPHPHYPLPALPIPHCCQIPSSSYSSTASYTSQSSPISLLFTFFTSFNHLVDNDTLLHQQCSPSAGKVVLLRHR